MPDAPPVVPVTVVAVADAVCVVNVTVATPLPLVVDVGDENDPFASDFDHVTVCPDELTLLLFTSRSWAVIVTLDPATGLDELAVTR